jgi:hypothetical protein
VFFKIYWRHAGGKSETVVSDSAERRTASYGVTDWTGAGCTVGANVGAKVGAKVVVVLGGVRSNIGRPSYKK